MSAETSGQQSLSRRDLLAKDRTLMANERTLLAYVRTAIMLVATGVTLIKLFPDSSFHRLFGIAVSVVGVVVSVVGFVRFRKMKIDIVGK